MEYKIEEIKGIIIGVIIANILILNIGKSEAETETSMIECLATVLKDKGIDFEKDEELFSFVMYLQKTNLGLYLLLKILTSDILMANPENCDKTIFSEEEFGMSSDENGVLIRGINVILFLFESIYRQEGYVGASITFLDWGESRQVLNNTLYIVATINGTQVDSEEFDLLLDEFKTRNKYWGFCLERIKEILKENETIDENVKYFQPWWNGETEIMVKFDELV